MFVYFAHFLHLDVMTDKRNNFRQSRGDDGHNLVTVIMNDFGFDVQEALDLIGRLHEDLVCQFMIVYEKLAQVLGDNEPDLDGQIRRYADALGNWVRANDQWSFEVCATSLLHHL